jgi:nitrogen fixation NifU-like protein
MNIYQEEILDHFKHPRHKGPVANASHSARLTNPTCGDELTLQLQVEDGRIAQIGFEGQGCAISQAAASMLSEELADKPVAAARDLSDQDMFKMIGVELTPARQKCGLLAVSALRKALKDLE